MRSRRYFLASSSTPIADIDTSAGITPVSVSLNDRLWLPFDKETAPASASTDAASSIQPASRNSFRHASTTGFAFPFGTLNLISLAFASNPVNRAGNVTANFGNTAAAWAAAFSAFERASSSACCFFFFNGTAATEIYTLSLHDALPIQARRGSSRSSTPVPRSEAAAGPVRRRRSEEHTSELQPRRDLVCRPLREKQ